MASNQPGFLLAIHGMTCAGCVARVEKAIARIPHATIAVDLLQHRAQVSGLTVDAAIAAIRAAGYEASLLSSEPNQSQATVRSVGSAGAVRTLSRHPFLLLIAGLALAVSTVDMVVMLNGRHWLSMGAALGLASLVLVLFGSPLLPKAMGAVRQGSANMQTLLLLGSGSAYAWSAGVWLGAWSGPVYFEATTVVLSMHHLGQWLEARARGRAIEALQPYLNPDSGPTQSPSPGEQIRVQAGETLPADGLVVSGQGHVDESLLTGESMPMQRAQGQLVYAGTQLLSGDLTIQIQLPREQWRR
ncbi:MAG: cation transporter, partial [Burkholderiaceae bacterium]